MGHNSYLAWNLQLAATARRGYRLRSMRLVCVTLADTRYGHKWHGEAQRRLQCGYWDSMVAQALVLTVSK
jgi:hypothetical protein